MWTVSLVEAGRAFGLRAVGLFTTIQLPAVLPAVISGLRLALAQAWLFLVAAELIASSAGLGFLLVDSQNNGRVDRILLAIILLAILGKLTDFDPRALRAVGRPAMDLSSEPRYVAAIRTTVGSWSRDSRARAPTGSIIRLSIRGRSSVASAARTASTIAPSTSDRLAMPSENMTRTCWPSGRYSSSTD